MFKTLAFSTTSTSTTLLLGSRYRHNGAPQQVRCTLNLPAFPLLSPRLAFNWPQQRPHCRFFGRNRGSSSVLRSPPGAGKYCLSLHFVAHTTRLLSQTVACQPRLVNTHPPLPQLKHTAGGYSRDLDNDCYKSPWHNPEVEQDKSDPSLEHIAGPGCKCTSAYATAYTGNEISFEEMQGCTTFRCLVRKRNDWNPASDDEEFERDPNFPMFLSGLHDRMPEREIGYVDVMYPMRHYMQEHSPEDIFWDGDWDLNDHYSMPFHPWCLEVYHRASKTWFDDKTDHMMGLLDWWRHRTSEETFSGRFPSTGRADNIGRLNDQWWYHEPGTEYIAANPLFIPNLAKVIANATTAEPVDGNSGVFDLPADTNFSPSPGDLFAKLPAELKLPILSSISSEDICNLRLASRSFRQLPLSLYRHMLAANLDFFWEAWPAKDHTPYPFLATTTAQKILDSPDHSRDPVAVPNLLDTSRINWYKLYYGLRHGMRNGELKGLANRNRIWNDCESILETIVKHWDEWEEERKSRMANS